MTQQRDVLEQIIARASREAEFRQELQEDPRGILQREYGVTMPDSIQINVVEETPTHFYLVLPPIPRGAGQELTEADLANVAGGWSAWTAECFSCSTAQCGTCEGALCGK